MNLFLIFDRFFDSVSSIDTDHEIAFFMIHHRLSLQISVNCFFLEDIVSAKKRKSEDLDYDVNGKSQKTEKKKRVVNQECQ